MYRILFSMLSSAILSVAGYPQTVALAQITASAPAGSERTTASASALSGRTTVGVRMISGTVREQGSGPLEGVVVRDKNGTSCSGSMQDGQYYIEIPAADSVLLFTADGYITQELKIKDGGDYNVVLRFAGACASPAVTSDRVPFSALGPWRGVFLLHPGNEEVDVPFNFEVRPGKDGQPGAFFRNGDEWFEGGRVTQTADSFYIALDQFDNELAFPKGESSLTGVLRRQDRTGVPLSVRITPGQLYRFADSGASPAGNLSGTYDVTVATSGGKEEKVVGLFKQEGTRLTGTFLRVTGDSRYLEGIVEGDRFYLSSFIGSGPSYFKGRFTADGHISGESVGPRGSQGFTGVFNPRAALPDPYTLTYLKPGYASFDLSLPDVDGHIVSLRDPKFKNKVVIVTIGGTWCPNCVDETSFLAPWYKANRSRGVEMVSIQYERQTDTAFIRKVLTRMRARYGIEYTQVFGGIADKQVVANSLPCLNTFLAFPTTIIIDKKGKVAKIHTGYSGPATGPYYQEFLTDFNREIDALVNQ